MRALVSWWLLLEALGLIALPLSYHLFSRRFDHGYGFSKVLALVATSYLAWLIGHLGIVDYRVLLIGCVVVFAALNLLLALRAREELVNWLRGGGWRKMAIHDALWTAGFLFFAWQRSLGPEIFGAEKYMGLRFFSTR